MNLDHLRYFKTIAECEHYGRAAEILHVSQPNLNYAVTQLESELGVPLFEKAGRNVRLTRYGRLFLQSVTESLQKLNESTRALQELGTGGGLVLLGSIRKLAAQTVPELMHDFWPSPAKRACGLSCTPKAVSAGTFCRPWPRNGWTWRSSATPATRPCLSACRLSGRPLWWWSHRGTRWQRRKA